MLEEHGVKELVTPPSKDGVTVQQLDTFIQDNGGVGGERPSIVSGLSTGRTGLSRL